MNSNGKIRELSLNEVNEVTGGGLLDILPVVFSTVVPDLTQAVAGYTNGIANELFDLIGVKG